MAKHFHYQKTKQTNQQTNKKTVTLSYVDNFFSGYVVSFLLEAFCDFESKCMPLREKCPY